jgi:POT family proton-dependent oligopeptide transporter
MPTGDYLDEAIGGAELKAGAADEKKNSLAIARDRQASVSGSMVHEGAPTEEELVTLRRTSHKIPLSILTIAFIELCERFSYYGTTVVFTNYIQQPLPEGSGFTGRSTTQPGVLGMGQQASTGLTTFNQFWQYTMPLFGAFIADAYLGRYKTINWALGIDIIGHLILIIGALPPVIEQGKGGTLACLIIGILVIGAGTGGFKPNVNPLIVEQLGEMNIHVKTLPSGERVIVDPAVTIERIYMWFYFFINVGALVGQVTMVYAEQYVGFWLSFTLPTVMLCLCPAVMAWGRKRYVRRPPQGSNLGPAFKLFFFAQRGRWSINPFETYRRLHDGTMWDNAKPSRIAPEHRPSWMNFDDAWVDEVRRGFNACVVFCWIPLFWLCYNQVNNNLVSQAAVMQRHGVPNDILSNLNPFALLIFIPLNDRIIYPALRKAGIRFSPIKKMASGFFVGCSAMIWAAVVQYYIYQKSECGWHASGEIFDEELGEMRACKEAPINVWAQTGSYVLVALSEVFTSITSLEYAFSKAPKNMRSMVQAVALFMTAFSAAIGQAFTSLAADPTLVWNYTVVACLAFVGGCCFYMQFRHLDKIEDELNALPEGMKVGSIDEEKRVDLEMDKRAQQTNTVE